MTMQQRLSILVRVLLGTLALSILGAVIASLNDKNSVVVFILVFNLLVVAGLGFISRYERGLVDNFTHSLNSIAGRLSSLAAGVFKLSIGDFEEDSDAGKESQSALIKSDQVVLEKLRTSLDDAIDCFGSITAEPCRRLFYIGSDSYAEGRACGEAASDLIKGKGCIAIALGDVVSVSQILRKRGFIDYIHEKYPSVNCIEVLEISESEQLSYELTIDAIKRFPDLSLIYVTQGATPAAVAKAVEDSGRKGETLIVCHDLTSLTMRAMSKGLIQAALSQDPYAQGYDTIIRLYNAVVDGWRPDTPRLLTKLELVSSDTMARFWDKAKGLSRFDVEREHSAIPSDKKPDKQIKIGFLCVGSENFWEPIRQGFIDAASLLLERGAQVEWISTPVGADGQRKASVFAPAINSLLEKGFDAIAVPLFNRDLIPFINEAVDRGVVVATYNSDPVSLREMIASATTHSNHLLKISQDLVSDAEQADHAAKRIDGTMETLISGFDANTREAARTKEELDSLATNIGKVEAAAGKSAKAACRMAEESKTAFNAIIKTRESVSALKSSVSETAQSIEKLKGDTERIKSIAAAIGDIANQTGILAINASIQAARSGERGKGFAVIATEIRQLAEQSNQSAENINQLLADVSQSADQAEKTIVHGLQDAERNVEETARSEKGLSEITEAAAENENRMSDILSIMEEVTNFTRRVELAMNALVDSNKTSESATTEVDRATDEMAKNASATATSAHRLISMAKAQQALLSQFAIGHGQKS